MGETRSCWGFGGRVWGERLRSRPRFVVWGPGAKRGFAPLRLGGLGGAASLPLAPPMPAVGELVAGTEPRRRRGGVRLMLKWVTD